jgi:hypothetical protein
MASESPEVKAVAPVLPWSPATATTTPTAPAAAPVAAVVAVTAPVVAPVAAVAAVEPEDVPEADLHEIVCDWIAVNLLPEDVFSPAKLADWAHRNNYCTKEEVVTALVASITTRTP